MKIAALVRSYHNTDYLEQVIRQFDWVDKVLVVNAKHLGYDPAPDDTEEIVERINQPNVQLLKLPDELEHTILNQGVSHLQDYDRIFICDADEMMPRENWETLLDLGHHSAGSCQLVNIMPTGMRVPVEHQPILVIRPDVMFDLQRCIENPDYKRFPCTIEHYGFMVKDYDWKIKNYKKMHIDGY